jgi:hypothetical protein
MKIRIMVFLVGKRDRMKTEKLPRDVMVDQDVIYIDVHICQYSPDRV